MWFVANSYFSTAMLQWVYYAYSYFQDKIALSYYSEFVKTSVLLLDFLRIYVIVLDLFIFFLKTKSQYVTLASQELSKPGWSQTIIENCTPLFHQWWNSRCAPTCLENCNFIILISVPLAHNSLPQIKWNNLKVINLW